MDSVQTLAFREILTQAAKKGASDLHISVGSRPMYRVDGTLQMMEDADVSTKESIAAIIEAIATPAQRQQLETQRDLIFSTAFENKIRAKVHIFYQETFRTLSLRFLSLHVQTLREMEVPAQIAEFAEVRQGLFLIGGANGSGRTTLAMALLEEVNRSRVEHILTIEDPIEYNLVSNKSIINQREVGIDVPTVENALDYAHREDIDLLFVSRAHSREAIKQVLELAASGMFVIMVVDAHSSVMAIESIISSFEAHEQHHIQTLLSDILKGILIQALVPKIGGGSVAVHELLLNNPSIKSLIGSNRLAQIDQLILASRAQGMMSLDHELSKYVRDQEVSLEQGRRFARDKNTLESLVKNG